METLSFIWLFASESRLENNFQLTHQTLKKKKKSIFYYLFEWNLENFCGFRGFSESLPRKHSSDDFTNSLRLNRNRSNIVRKFLAVVVDHVILQFSTEYFLKFFIRLFCRLFFFLFPLKFFLFLTLKILHTFLFTNLSQTRK